MQKGFAPILIIIVVAVTVLFIYQFNQVYNKAQKSYPQPTPTTQDKVTNWEVYKNDKYKYEILYPSSWIPKIYEIDVEQTLNLFKDESMTKVSGVSIKVIKSLEHTKYSSVKTYFDEIYNKAPESARFSVNGSPAVKSTEVPKSGGINKSLLTTIYKDDKVYEIENVFQEEEEIYNQIVESFKFTD